MRRPVGVCNDSMVNIFERLPPKSIIRFRSLSKYWHSRLVSPEFLRDHRLRCSKNPPKLLIRHVLYCGNYDYRDIHTLHSADQLPLVPGSGYVGLPGVEFRYQRRISVRDPSYVVGSSNGIICLRHDQLSLWNLSIRRRLIVPSHPCVKLSTENRYEFPLGGNKVILGFGFDPITDDYKIVAISYELGGNNAFIYSLKTETWSAIRSPSTAIYNVVSKKACMLNGILHWVVDGLLTTRTRFILTFDLNSHVFGHILCPEPRKIRLLTTINGCLAAVSWEGGDVREGGEYNSWIWVMEEYSDIKSWSVRYKLETRGAFDATGVYQSIGNGDILAYCPRGRGSEVYNFQTRMFTKLMNFGACCYDVEMELCGESLELVDKESATTHGETIMSWDNKRYCGCSLSRLQKMFNGG